MGAILELFFALFIGTSPVEEGYYTQSFATKQECDEFKQDIDEREMPAGFEYGCVEVRVSFPKRGTL